MPVTTRDAEEHFSQGPVAIAGSAAGIAALCSGLIAALTIVLVDPSGWHAGLIVDTAGLWLLPVASGVAVSVAALYSRLLRAEVISADRSTRWRLTRHPIGRSTLAAPVVTPFLALLVGRGRLTETLVVVTVLVLAQLAALEWFRRRFLPFTLEGMVAVDEFLAAARLYIAGIVTVAAVTAAVIGADWLYDGTVGQADLSYELATGLTLAVAIAYAGFSSVWIPRVPVEHLGLRVTTLLAWPLLIAPQFRVRDSAALMIGVVAIALFVAIVEPIRRRAIRDYRSELAG